MSEELTMILTTVRATLPLSKQAEKYVDMGRFDPKKLNYAEIKGQYQVEVPNKCAALEYLNDNVDINRALY
jgi:hypothetical protein